MKKREFRLGCSKDDAQEPSSTRNDAGFENKEVPHATSTGWNHGANSRFDGTNDVGVHTAHALAHRDHLVFRKVKCRFAIWQRDASTARQSAFGDGLRHQRVE